MIRRLFAVALALLFAGEARAQFSTPVTIQDPLTGTLPTNLWRIRVSNGTITIENNASANGSFGSVLTPFSATGTTVTLPGLAASGCVQASVTGQLSVTGSPCATAITLPVSLANGGTGADLSATGGTSRFLKQASVGAVITVVRPTCSDLSDSSGGCTMSTMAGGDLSGTLPSPTVAKVDGVAYPSGPSTNTVPVVTGANTVTYETVPNAALTNSSLTVAAGTGLSGGGAVSLGSSVTLNMSTPVSLTNGGTGSNLSATGGTSQFLKQASAGAVITVVRPTCSDLSDSSGGCTMSITAGGDLSGTLPSPTVAKVNGVAFSSGPSTHTIPVITAANTATYKALTDCQDTGGNHLNYTSSTDTFSCGTSGGASGANPTASVVSNSAINGSAATFLRSDGAPAISTSAVFQLARVGLGAAADATNLLQTSAGSFINSSGALANNVVTNHSIGAAPRGNTVFTISGNVASTTYGVYVDTTVNPAINAQPFGIALAPVIQEAGSSDHAVETFLTIAGTITNGGSTATDAIAEDIQTFAAATGTTTATGLRVAAPTAATNNYGAQIGGRIKFGGINSEGSTKDALCRDSSTTEVLYNSGVSTCLVSNDDVKHDITDIQWNVGLKTDLLDAMDKSTSDNVLASIATTASVIAPNAGNWAKSAGDFIDRVQLHNFFFDQADNDVNHRLQHFGFLASEIAALEPRLARYDKNGKAVAVEYQEVVPIIIEDLKMVHQRISCIIANPTDLKVCN